MRRSWSVAERALLVMAVMLTAAWCGLVLDVVLAYRGGSTASTWSARLVMLFLAGVVTAAVVMLGRRNWLRAIARPLPERGLNGWMARWPGWVLALFYWVVFGGAGVGVIVWVGHAEGHGLPAAAAVSLFVTWAILAAGIALMNRVIWRRQAENCNAGLRSTGFSHEPHDRI